MLARQIRSGLTETYHDGAIALVDARGELVASTGDIDRPFFLRSSAKPFQAFVSQEAGAGLAPLELALACASHRGYPAHIALVEAILSQAGLDESALQTPHAWPIAPEATRLLQRSGATGPRRIWHNCSGKHAGFLRACVASGLPVDTYLDPDHPLQRRIVEFVSDLGGYPVDPVGVDGCGAPVLRTTVRVMATMFARLATEERFVEVFTAMHRYPALVSGNAQPDTAVAIATNSVAKGGAAGCIGVAVGQRLGLGAKSWDGNWEIAGLGAAAALDQLGVLSPTALESLEPVIRPPVLGGGEQQGQIEPVFSL